MLDIIYEDNHLLTLFKPAGLATMGLPEGEETLLTLAKKYIKRKYDKHGEVYLGVVSRLDVPVSGVVLFARTSKAAARLNEQFRKHTVEKIYLAIVEGKIFPAESELIGNICEDKRHRKVKLTDNVDGKESKLRYRKLEYIGNNSLIEINLLTGRKHQIRAQLSEFGFPVLGDIKYGAKNKYNVNINRNKKNKCDFALQKNNGSRIALHAYKLSIDHPVTGVRITFETPYSLLSRELPQILSICQNKRTCQKGNSG
ncbi:MAG: RluA family pseudouridine synthase [Planctomycetaceae bacterium]|jgi:23S rRNA pseudouridine1911/1915/1917 synthase|nr:RluA family pseudouridine synthase [Planctomycetaceae bacterium]